MELFVHIRLYMMRHMLCVLICVVILFLNIYCSFLFLPTTSIWINRSKLFGLFIDDPFIDVSQSACYCHLRKEKTHECDFMLNRSVLIHQPLLNTSLRHLHAFFLINGGYRKSINSHHLFFLLFLRFGIKKQTLKKFFLVC